VCAENAYTEDCPLASIFFLSKKKIDTSESRKCHDIAIVVLSVSNIF